MTGPSLGIFSAPCHSCLEIKFIKAITTLEKIANDALLPSGLPFGGAYEIFSGALSIGRILG
jgi:hypothetical protein